MMRIRYVIAVSLVALLAVSAMAASSALAASEWQSDGTSIGSATSAKSTGLLELITLVEEGSSARLFTVDCEAVFDDTVGPGSDDETTKVLSTSGGEIGTLTSGEALNCTVTQSAGGLVDCFAKELAKVWPEGLPWKTELELMSAAPTVLDRILNGGTEIECKTPIGNLSTTCGFTTSAGVQNVTGGVESRFSYESPIDSEASSCSLTGAGTGVVSGSVVTSLEDGLTLTVAE